MRRNLHLRGSILFEHVHDLTEFGLEYTKILRLRHIVLHFDIITFLHCGRNQRLLERPLSTKNDGGWAHNLFENA